MRMDRQGSVYVLEVNPNPDISPDSGAALQARNAGLDYNEFIGKIVALAVEGDDGGF
jgi:D-alanine-D-alanine ligase